jgi:hypothetical protein
MEIALHSQKIHSLSQKVVLHGEAGSANQVYVEIAEVGLPKHFQGVDAYDIYNNELLS